MQQSAGRDNAVCLCARLRICRRRRAQVLADDLAKRFPENTLVQVNFLSTLRAKLSVSRGNTPEAIETLRAAAPFELGQTTFSTYGWNVMYPVFVRAEAYLAAHQSSGAAVEFQKILYHPGVVGNQYRRSRSSWSRTRICVARRHRQSQGCLSEFPRALERRRPRRPHPETSESGIRKTAVTPAPRFA